MAILPHYSTLFTCLHDEAEPAGSLGRGTHYSVCRTVEWLDVERRRLPLAQLHDFAIIWDEDHDTRVIEAIERIYMAGLLSPVQFIGERKGGLTVIVAARFYFSGPNGAIEAYQKAVEAICQDLDDPWTSEVGCFDRAPGNPHQNFYEGLISADDHRVGLYLANIDSLWRLGTRDYVPARELVLPPMPPSGLAFSTEIRRPPVFPPKGVLPPVA